LHKDEPIDETGDEGQGDGTQGHLQSGSRSHTGQGHIPEN